MAAEPGRAGVEVSGRRWLIILLVGAAVTLLVGRAFAQVYTDYLWYASLGMAEIWRAKTSSLVILRLGCGIVATAFVFANLYAVRQSVVSLVLPRRIGNLDFGEEVPRQQLTWAAGVLSVLIGTVFAWSQRDWSGFLGARIGQPFGESDPYFVADLGFFVYRLPFELDLFTWTMTVVLIVIGLVVLLYALTPSLRWEQGGLYVSGYVRRHLAMLAGVLLLVLAWHYRLEMYLVLGNGSATDGAFTALDHRVGIPASLLLSLVTLGAGLTVLWSGWTGQLRLAFAALTGVIVAALAARQVAPFIARRATANRDVVVRERPYEAIRAGYTRRAFAVDRIATADSDLVLGSLEDAALQVPVWDDGALRRASDRALPGASVGWFSTDSGLIAVLPTLAGGSVAAYVASGTEDNGTPLRAFRDAPRDAPRVLVTADSTARSIPVPDSTGRIAAPSLVDPVARFAHSLSMQDFTLWFGNLPGPAPKLASRRTVRERVRALAPFFVQGQTIAPMWSADSLVWALELYAASGTYPLSRRVTIAGAERAYFQHAATALVNATTGRTILVVDSVPVPDPITSTWHRQFPRLFVRAGALPASLRRQMPPARDGARAQAVAFGRYGTRGGTGEPRQLPDDEGPDSALAGTPQPLMAFPRLGATGHVLPLVDRSDRLQGLLIALGGPSHRSVWLPAASSAPVWSEGLDRLRAADTISASLLVRGYVRAVPLAGQIALLQPRYDWRGGGAPRLLYVTGLVGDSVRSARTLLQLAGRLPDSAGVTGGDLRGRALRLYEEMRRASARGDWQAYGRAFDALGVLLRERRPR
ncbi:MAG: UPF0182 family protein [Gemmatimonadaceae bacterium]